MTTTDQSTSPATRLYGAHISTVRTMLHGFDAAAARVQHAAVQKNPNDLFIALFEALNWSVVLDDRIATHWAPDGKPLGWNWRQRAENGDTIAAARFVRNRVHHQWADALHLDESGLRIPLTVPITFHEWLWIDVDQLPNGRDTHGQNEYQTLLQGKPARNTVRTMQGTLHWVIDRLEPARWTESG